MSRLPTIAALLMISSLAVAGTPPDPANPSADPTPAPAPPSSPKPEMAKGALDGKSFTIKLDLEDAAVGQTSKMDDTLTFAHGKLESPALETQGFDAATYTTFDEKGAIRFEVNATSGTGGTAVFSGRVRGDLVDGTLVRTKPGEAPVRWTFTGALKKTEPRTGA